MSGPGRGQNGQGPGQDIPDILLGQGTRAGECEGQVGAVGAKEFARFRPIATESLGGGPQIVLTIPDKMDWIRFEENQPWRLPMDRPIGQGGVGIQGRLNDMMDITANYLGQFGTNIALWELCRRRRRRLGVLFVWIFLIVDGFVSAVQHSMYLLSFRRSRGNS